MKSSIILLSSALFSHSSAHYLFGRLIFDNHWTGTWEYIRQISPKEGVDSELALPFPNTDPTSPDIRCGRNASVSFLNHPKTATVQAGAIVGFAAGEPNITPPVARIYHPGFASAWLSKAPSDSSDGLDKYAGDGDWFKILQVTTRTEQSLDFTKPENARMYDRYKAFWGTFDVDSWNFTIPATTPPGKYLLRFEHIFPNTYDSQFYVNCAHINIVNTNAQVGTPGPLVKIPGVYTRGQPDVYFDHYDQHLVDTNATEFVPPAPKVWSG